jgi:phenylalanyl-tRNA synthetase beta chain
MKTSIRWLQNYIDIPWEAAELAERLTLAGLEVEGIERLGELPPTVVVGEILTRATHPNADRLSICTVGTGAATPLQVVCGAPNCDAGQKIACALVGTELRGVTIRKAKIRGVESFGMICAEDELGLSNDHSGIVVLPASAPVGVPVSAVLGTDTVIDWEVTPNRCDWNSHVGIAREIAAVSGTLAQFRLPATTWREAVGVRLDELTAVEVLAPDLCPRYIARLIRNVRIGPSPEWLQKALKAVGIRPINNVVDITNYVMMECGQPLHAFDYELLEGRRIVVRRARPGDHMVTLDGTERPLTPETLLICDGARAVALAGIMGGANSVIRNETTTVLLESACFEPACIRATSRRVGLSSESSYRFERGIDIEMTEWASRRAAALMSELAGGEVVPDRLDLYSRPYQPAEVTARFERIDSLIGVPIAPAAVRGFLENLGLEVTSLTAETISTRIPAWRRTDLTREVDLIEEVARLYGLNNIVGSAPAAQLGGKRADDCYYPIEAARAQLRALGLDETMTYSFVHPHAAVLCSGVLECQLVRPLNPISAELGAMRPTLIPGVLATAAHNIARGLDDLAFFELGRVLVHDPALPEERLQIAIVMTGRAQPGRFGDEKKRELDLFDLKGVLEGWFAARRLSPTCAAVASHPAFRDGACGSLELAGEPVAVFGQVCEELTRDMRLKSPLFMALIEFDRVRACAPSPMTYRPLPQFPAVARDISFVVDSKVTHRQIVETIAALRLPLVEAIELFDIYQDEKTLGQGRISMAYTVTYRDPQQTLTDKDVNSVHEQVRTHLAATLGAELR